jgi:hypothetical protein
MTRRRLTVAAIGKERRMDRQDGQREKKPDDVHVPGEEAAVPPSAAGDVEDAVAPKEGGDLTSWSPSGHEAEEDPARQDEAG